MILDRLRRWRPEAGIHALLLGVALFLVLTQNLSFWRQVWRAFPVDRGFHDASLVAVLFLAMTAFMVLVMLPLSARAIVKPVLMALLLIASVCSYFMDSYGVVIDDQMMVNLFQTDPREAGELIGVPLIAHVLLFGLLPCVVVARVRVRGDGWLRGLVRRLLLAVLMVAVFVGSALVHYKSLSLWARNNREVRAYINPTYPIYAFDKYLRHDPRAERIQATPIATDARRLPSPSGKARFVVLVVGETARAANFGLTGYARQTTPELAATEGLVSFPNVWSCGTATAVSVPCMFSNLGRRSFTRDKAGKRENLLDVLARTGVSVLWRDNNSDCKGVCARVPSEDLRRSQDAALCSGGECRDEILLKGLEERLAAAAADHGDQLVVLHLLGSHGPSYFRRYPPEFRRFTPDCARDDVQACPREEIVNAYDNTILYTDHVLARLIALLRSHEQALEPTMLYVSDHGESLGEDGLYLHGLPWSIAPEVQKHVPFVVWSPSLDRACLEAQRGNEWSHDDLFHTVLGLYGIATAEYRDTDDMFRGCHAG